VIAAMCRRRLPNATSGLVQESPAERPRRANDTNQTVGRAWRAHPARRGLSATHPFASEFLDFYKRVASFQAELRPSFAASSDAKSARSLRTAAALRSA